MLFAIALGGAAGTMARVGLGALLAPWSAGFPFATLLINVTGGFTIGWLAGDGSPLASAPTMRLALTVGFCGGFTTFSAFSLEALRLIQRGEVGRAALYSVLSVVLSVGAAALGLAASRAIGGGR